MTKMKFGIQAGQATVSWREVADMWRFLDRETAFHAAWAFDHFVAGDPAGDLRGICFEGWTSLAALAAMTERIRLGVLVTGVTYRNPAVLAKMAVTVDHISDGRLEMGIGAAWHEPEHRMYAIDFPPNGERQDRLEEAVQILRMAFENDGPVSFQGKHYRLKGAIFDPKPVQQPRIPILIGSGGEKRGLRTAARYADAINVAGTPEMVRHKIDVLERHCRDAGRDPSEIETTYWGPIIVSENEAFLERVAGMIATAQLGALGAGMTPQDVRRTMPIGDAAHVREVVEQYAAVGVSQMIMPSQPPWKREVYERISREVVERFV